MGVRKEIYAETREKNTRLQLSQVYIQVHTYKHINILFLGGIIAQRARLFFFARLELYSADTCAKGDNEYSAHVASPTLTRVFLTVGVELARR